VFLHKYFKKNQVNNISSKFPHTQITISILKISFLPFPIERMKEERVEK
jgi:hypothetical protein